MNKIPNLSAENSPKTTSLQSLKIKKYIPKTLAIVLALTVWHTLSIFVGSDLLLVSPLTIVKRLLELVREADFMSTVLFTFSRITLGFLSGFLLGITLALLAGKFPLAETLFHPYMVTVKTVPVASFVVLALIWIEGEGLAWLISFLMVLPIIYTNLLDGIKSIDKKMLQMADVFRIPFGRRLRFIWLPSVKPFLVSGTKIALGLAWKSGVAAELIGYPKGSVGEALYYSKLYLETADVFAWTVVIVALSVVLEKLFVFLLKVFFKGVEKI